VNQGFVSGLNTPEGIADYKAQFTRAVDNVVQVWKGLDDALAGTDRKFLDSLQDWNLDTGRTEPEGKLVFWGNF
jgi:hypothetical protein